MARCVTIAPFLLSCLMGAQEPEIRCTGADRTSLAVTVYADHRALVRDVRSVSLPEGTSILAFSDVSDQMKPATALFHELGDRPGLEVLERAFAFDLITPTRLLERSVDLPVRVKVGESDLEGILRGVPHGELWAPPRTPLEAKTIPNKPLQRLAGINPWRRRLFTADPDVLVETPVGFLSARPEEVVPKSLPDGLRSRPTLLQAIRTKVSGAREFALTYLTEGLTWEATYQAEIHPEGQFLDLTAFLTVRNETGISFPDTTLQLVAGSPNRVWEVDENTDPDKTQVDRTDTKTVAAVEVIAAPLEEKLSEYLLITLPRPTSLRAGQEKQIFFFHREGIPVEAHWAGYAQLLGPEDEASPSDTLVARYARIRNLKGGPLDRPLPKGKVYLTSGGILLGAPGSEIRQAEHGPGCLPGASSDLEDTPVGEEFDLFLAEDPRIRVVFRRGNWRAESFWEHLFRRRGHRVTENPMEEGVAPAPTSKRGERCEATLTLENGHSEIVPLKLICEMPSETEVLGQAVPLINPSPGVYEINVVLRPSETRTIRLTVRKP